MRGCFSTDPLDFTAAKSYTDKIQSSLKKSGTREAVVTGHGRIGGYDAVGCRHGISIHRRVDGLGRGGEGHTGY